MRFLTNNKSRPYLECANDSDVGLSTNPIRTDIRFAFEHAGSCALAHRSRIMCVLKSRCYPHPFWIPNLPIRFNIS